MPLQTQQHNNAQPQLTKRRGMTVFKYTQVRKYRFIPPDFLLQMKSWFVQQKFVIKKNHRGTGNLSGRRDGIHVNFVPKFLIAVKQFADHAEVTFTYAARIRKIGIATAILTEGLSLVVGAVTLSSHIASARAFVDQVTTIMDSISGAPYEIDWVDATEAPGSETATTTTKTVTRSAPPAPVPVIEPPSPVVAKPLPPAPLINLMDLSPQMERFVPMVEPMIQPQQPQIIVVPQQTIVIHAPHQGYPYGMDPSFASLQDGSSFPSSSTPFDAPQTQLPQIAYMPSNPPVSLGEVTVPTMVERPTMLHSTRYPMPQEVPTMSAAPSVYAAPASSVSNAQRRPMMKSNSFTDVVQDPSSFSLDKPMFSAQPVATPSYGSARN